MKLPETEVDAWFFSFPYGKWTCADGREVLFNRDYCPIWQRRPGQPARPAYPFEWVNNIVECEMYFDDGSFRGIERGMFTIKRLNAVLASWGLPKLPPRPKYPPLRRGRANRLQWRR